MLQRLILITMEGYSDSDTIGLAAQKSINKLEEYKTCLLNDKIDSIKIFMYEVRGNYYTLPLG